MPDGLHKAFGRRIKLRTKSTASPGGKALPQFKFTGQHSEAIAARAIGRIKGDQRLPDAWHGSFGTVASRLLATRSQGSSGALAEVIIGPDDRVEITDTTMPPYEWICELIITAANGTAWMGTGWLAAPRLVITAGHCVYMQNQGGWIETVEVFPARRGMTVPYSVVASEVHTVNGWAQQGSPDFDYGAIVLPDTAFAKISGGLGFFGFGVLSDVELIGLLANVSGYPADKEPGTLWGSARVLKSVTADTLNYDIDTYGGMSGAPVIRWDGTDYIVVGIHNYGDVTGNSATRITSDVFQNIQLWKSLTNW
jgi:V8-like Glu-specific endopeptidase